jgi:hypothetical protein
VELRAELEDMLLAEVELADVELEDADPELVEADTELVEEPEADEAEAVPVDATNPV